MPNHLFPQLVSVPSCCHGSRNWVTWTANGTTACLAWLPSPLTRTNTALVRKALPSSVTATPSTASISSSRLLTGLVDSTWHLVSAARVLVSQFYFLLWKSTIKIGDWRLSWWYSSTNQPKEPQWLIFKSLHSDATFSIAKNKPFLHIIWSDLLISSTCKVVWLPQLGQVSCTWARTATWRALKRCTDCSRSSRTGKLTRICR